MASFDWASLRRVRHDAPWVAVAPLCEGRPPSRAGLAAIALFAAGIGVRHEYVDAPLVVDAHAHRLSVLAWTADALADVERLLALGVDGVITNVPDVARSATAAGAVPAVA